jgi:uncharacterized repeat protein (TIGR03806 family)
LVIDYWMLDIHFLLSVLFYFPATCLYNFTAYSIVTTMKRFVTITILLLLTGAAALYLPCCQAKAGGFTDGLVLLPRISDYQVFQGNPANLVPTPAFQRYELATGLFTDHAEKLRLMHLPAGQQLTALDDGLPQLPDGIILMKTFYYYHDKRTPAKGRRLIETRILVKQAGQWQGGTYVWNTAQTEAVLTTRASVVPVSWIDAAAQQKQVNYQVPAMSDCGTCHRANKQLQPIGIKIRNLNREVVQDGKPVNQLQYWLQQGILQTTDLTRFTRLPAGDQAAYTLEDRVRAYLDVNCAHCHSDAGSCSMAGLRLGYEVPLENTRIIAKRKSIIHQLEKGRMPRVGTSVVDTEGVRLIRAYVKKL